MKNKPVLFIAASECRPDVEEKYNKWYDEVHVPWVMKYVSVISEKHTWTKTKGYK